MENDVGILRGFIPEASSRIVMSFMKLSLKNNDGEEKIVKISSR